MKTNEIVKALKIKQPLLDKLNKLNINLITYAQFHRMSIQKRGKSKESLSDAKNMLRRALADQVLDTEKASMSEAYRVGTALFDGCCYLCGKPLEDGERGVQADHVVSHLKGGYGAAGNMLPAHAECNDKKSDEMYEDTVYYNPENFEKILKFREAYNFNYSNEIMWALIDKVADKHIQQMQQEVAELMGAFNGKNPMEAITKLIGVDEEIVKLMQDKNK